jgi:hypothetical protein
MRHLIHVTIGKPTDRLARRLRTARPGSVLILVVALLVLMALIGTAWLTTARTDRQTSQQNNENVELEMLVQSAMKLVESAIVDDTVAGARFRPRPGNRPLDYEHYDSPLRDPELASRVPLKASAAPPPNDPPYWQFISGPPTLDGFESPFSRDVNGAPLNTLPDGEFPNRYQGRIRAMVGTEMLWVPVNAVPTFITVPTPEGGTQEYPALQFPNPDPAPDGVGTPWEGATFLAADTDNDGIADAALFPLPVSDGGAGIKWYAAVRAIDNNSAVNAAVAWKPNVPSNTTVPPIDPLPWHPAGQFFPSNVDLHRMLRVDPNAPPATQEDQRIAQMDGLDRVRLSASTADDSSAGPEPVPTAAYFPVLNDSGRAPVIGTPPMLQTRYLMDGEARWRMLGSRPSNPGFNGAFTPDWLYKNLPVGESMAMAYRFALANPFASASILESPDRLWYSLYSEPVRGNAAPHWYQGKYADPYDWFFDHFDYVDHFDPTLSPPLPDPNLMPLRALLVARNAVSNASPSQFVDMGEWRDDTNYLMGHRVRWTPVGDTVQRSYVCIRANGPFFRDPITNNALIAPPGDSIGEGVWEPMPWHEVPTRANINTATFGQLWAAYWSVMNAGSATGPLTHDTPSDTVTQMDPIRVGGAAPFPAPAAAIPPPERGRLAPPVERRQFRNVLRDPGHLTNVNIAPAETIYQITPYEVMRLRAALAAVNAMDMRDADGDVTSRRIVLRAYAYPQDVTQPGAIPLEDEVDVVVYGNEAQPFITEIYVDNFNSLPTPDTAAMPAPTENANGYVAIELHNPTDQPIRLSNWNLGIIDRRRRGAAPAPAKPYPDMVIRAITDFPGFGFGAAAPTIPPRGYLLLENYDGNGSVGHRPQSTGLPLTGPAGVASKYVKNLHEVMRKVPANNLLAGGELVLLRPRRADGVLENANPNDPFNQQFEQASVTYIAPSGVEPTVQSMALATLVPVDSFDFTEFEQAAAADDALFYQWHYARANGFGPHAFLPDEPDIDNHWECVFPGRWDAAHRWSTEEYRQEGIDFATWDASATAPWEDDGTTPNPDPTAKTRPKTMSFAAGRSESSFAYRPQRAMQLNQYWFGGFNKTLAAPEPVSTAAADAPWMYPYGGFARNGDMLQVPFIGAYTIRRKGTDPGHILEMNAITIDSVFAHDADTAYVNDVDTTGGGDSDSTPDWATPNDSVEHVGRFCPLVEAYPTYDWASDIFDHLTVDSPQDDHLPAVDPFSFPGELPQGVNNISSAQPASVTYGRVTGAPQLRRINVEPNLIVQDVNGANRDDFYNGCRIRMLTGVAAGSSRQIADYDVDHLATPPTVEIHYADPFTDRNNAPIIPASGDLFQILGPSEDAAGIEGLVNINTAPLEVLAAVPMLYRPAGPDYDDPEHLVTKQIRAANRQLAQEIITYRSTVGPFKTLFDLNKVPGFKTAFVSEMLPGTPVVPPAQAQFEASDPDDAQGDYSPYNFRDPDNTINPPDLDGVKDDFEREYLMVNRVSNLLTVRSDTYTVYVEVQGWRDVGSDSPSLAVQRRQAFIVDRNPLSQNNRVLTSVNIPND